MIADAPQGGLLAPSDTLGDMRRRTAAEAAYRRACTLVSRGIDRDEALQELSNRDARIGSLLGDDGGGGVLSPDDLALEYDEAFAVRHQEPDLSGADYLSRESLRLDALVLLRPGAGRKKTLSKLRQQTEESAILAGTDVPPTKLLRRALKDAETDTAAMSTPAVLSSQAAEPTRPDAVQERLERLRVDAEAKRLHAEEQEAASTLPRPRTASLAERLAAPEVVQWRIEGLTPAASRTLIEARRKTGKTTLMANLIRCLLTGEDFLGRFPVTPVSGSVLFMNYEMSGATLDRWLADLGLSPNLQARVIVMDLRGTRNPLATEQGRERLAAELRSFDTSVLLVDVFARAFNGDQNSNSEVAAFLAHLDQVVAAAGAEEVILSAHSGWGDSERARGASALEDWPDSIISLTQDGTTPTAPRYFRAFGRDVDVDKDQLEFNPETRMLRLNGSGGPTAARKAEKVAELAKPVQAAITATPGVTAQGIADWLRKRGHAFRKGEDAAAIASLVGLGLVHRAQDLHDKRRTRHWPADQVPAEYRPDPDFLTPTHITNTTN